MSTSQTSGFYLVTDPDQELKGFYKLSKTSNFQTTLSQLNLARANRDFKVVRFFPVSDLKRADEFIKSAMKNRYISNNLEWIKIDETGLNKVINTVETLINIVNES